ncbi:hypothetical protein DFH09DRAFT_1080939 [Mycena vulgaris]|nr:hypothetical protein DFH09DRAFT_1080939 [Mycena vulgaris]
MTHFQYPEYEANDVFNVRRILEMYCICAREEQHGPSTVLWERAELVPARGVPRRFQKQIPREYFIKMMWDLGGGSYTSTPTVAMPSKRPRCTQSYQEILHNIWMPLHPKFSQKPQLGSSHPIGTGHEAAVHYVMFLKLYRLSLVALPWSSGMHTSEDDLVLEHVKPVRGIRAGHNQPRRFHSTSAFNLESPEGDPGVHTECTPYTNT